MHQVKLSTVKVHFPSLLYVVKYTNIIVLYKLVVYKMYTSDLEYKN